MKMHINFCLNKFLKLKIKKFSNFKILKEISQNKFLLIFKLKKLADIMEY